MDTNGLAQLHDVLTDCGIPYWVDSGVLLGLVRSGRLNSWEKDIDLAICGDDLDQVIKMLESFKRVGYSAVVNRYRGYVYSIGLKPTGKGTETLLEASIHVFYSTGKYLWSPQPQFYMPPPAPDIRKEKRSFLGRLLQTSILKLMTARKPEENATKRIVPIRKSLAYTLLYSMYIKIDKYVFTSIWPFREVFEVYTWLVLKDLILPLSDLPIEGRSFPIPGRVEEYLSYRYGNWKIPRKEWFYWEDDGSIIKDEPCKVKKKILEAFPPYSPELSL